MTDKLRADRPWTPQVLVFHGGERGNQLPRQRRSKTNELGGGGVSHEQNTVSTSPFNTSPNNTEKTDPAYPHK